MKYGANLAFVHNIGAQKLNQTVKNTGVHEHNKRNLVR